VTTNLRDNIRLTIPELNMSGGIGAAGPASGPGSLLTLKIPTAVRNIRRASHRAGRAGRRRWRSSLWIWIWMNAHG